MHKRGLSSCQSVPCTSSSWMHTPNGWTSTPCKPSLQQKQLRSFASFLRIMAFHARSSQTTVRLLRVPNFNNSCRTMEFPTSRVQTFKQGVAKISGDTIQAKFLYKYRITPHSVTGVAPSELLCGRRLRCRLDNWYPDISQRVENRQLQQKQAHDTSAPLRSFSTGDLVYAENFTGSPPKWSPGTVIEVTGPLSYRVELQTGTSVRRHVDSLRKRQAMGDVGNHSGGSKILHPDPALHHHQYHPHPSVVLHDNASQGTDTARLVTYEGGVW